MSDLRERIDAAARRAADNSWGQAMSGKGMMFAAVEAAVEAILPIIEADFEEERKNTVVCGDCGGLAGPGCDYLGHGLVELSELLDHWSNPADQAGNERRCSVCSDTGVISSSPFVEEPCPKCRIGINDANKLLEQTIEVLEDFPTFLCSRSTAGKRWYTIKAKPLLDNLKALKKEGTE